MTDDFAGTIPVPTKKTTRKKKAPVRKKTTRKKVTTKRSSNGFAPEPKPVTLDGIEGSDYALDAIREHAATRGLTIPEALDDIVRGFSQWQEDQVAKKAMAKPVSTERPSGRPHIEPGETRTPSHEVDPNVIWYLETNTSKILGTEQDGPLVFVCEADAVAAQGSHPRFQNTGLQAMNVRGGKYKGFLHFDIQSIEGMRVPEKGMFLREYKQRRWEFARGA